MIFNDIVNNLCGRFGQGETLAACSTAIVGMPKGTAVSVALGVLGSMTYCGVNQYNNYKKIKAEKIVKEAELHAEQEKIAEAAQEALLKRTMLIQACEQVQLRKETNKEILNNLFITEYSIPLEYPEGAAEIGCLPAQSSDCNEDQPAFDEKTAAEVTEIRAQIKIALENQEAMPLPNLLLSGVAGVGKSMLIADLCKTTGVGFIKVPAGTFESQISIGNEVETLNNILEVADSSKAPVYLMLDDGERLFEKTAIQQQAASTEKGLNLPWETEADRINSNDIIKHRRSALVQAIIGLAEQSDRKISFALTTNRLEVVLDRFKNISMAIEIQPPQKEQRMEIIKQRLGKTFGIKNPIVGYFSSDRMLRLGDKTEGFTGRNIEKMIELLASLVKNDPSMISDEQIDEAIEMTKPSVEALRNKKI